MFFKPPTSLQRTALQCSKKTALMTSLCFCKRHVRNERVESRPRSWKSTFIPDGSSDFTERHGYASWKNDIGFGKRSWRYSMFWLENGVVEKMFIEDVPGDPFKVSDADTVAATTLLLSTKGKSITVFTKPGCRFLYGETKPNRQRSKLRKVVLGKERNDLRAISGRTAVPQVFIGGKHIGW